MPALGALARLVGRHPVAAFGVFFALFPFLMPYKALASQVPTVEVQQRSLAIYEALIDSAVSAFEVMR